MGLLLPNLIGWLAVDGLRLGANVLLTRFGAGVEVGIGLGEKVFGEKVGGKGLLEGGGLRLGENVLLITFGNGVAVGTGLGEKVVGEKVDGKGLLEGVAVGLGRRLGAKVLEGKDVSNGGVVGRLVGAGLLDGPTRPCRRLVGLGLGLRLC